MNGLTITCSTACGKGSLKLSCVRRRVPLDRIFEELSVLLGCIRDLAYGAEVEEVCPRSRRFAT